MKLLLSLFMSISFIGALCAMENRDAYALIDPASADIQPCQCGCTTTSNAVREQHGIKKWHVLGISFLQKKEGYDCIVSKQRSGSAPRFFVKREGPDLFEGFVSGQEAKALWYALKKEFNGKK